VKQIRYAQNVQVTYLHKEKNVLNPVKLDGSQKVMKIVLNVQKHAKSVNQKLLVVNVSQNLF
jgi:hypothetical protein